MRNIICSLLAFTVLLSSAVCAPLAYGADTAYKPIIGKTADDKNYRWSKKLNGLQVGIRLDTPTKIYKQGSSWRCKIMLRNLSKQPIRLMDVVFLRQSILEHLHIINADGTPLTKKQHDALFEPLLKEVGSFPGSMIYQVLQPQERLEWEQGDLSISSEATANNEPSLYAPGKYKITFEFRMTRKWSPDEIRYVPVKPTPSHPAPYDISPYPLWQGVLTTPPIIIETTP